MGGGEGVSGYEQKFHPEVPMSVLIVMNLTPRPCLPTCIIMVDEKFVLIFYLSSTVF